MFSPLLTEADPIASSEGSLNPLGLESIADTLAVRLVPGVRERQQHPRFLTATAVSLAICEAFDEDELASDDVSEPWQVFEWCLVTGLVVTAEDNKQIRGLPGRDKAASAIRDRVPLSASRYLKTPNVFGFHGVYRLLARTLGIQAAGRLGEAGYELLSTWADEQDLLGLCGTADGPGRQWRTKLCGVVRDSLASGSVARQPNWDGWKFFGEHIRPYEAGPREAGVIRRLLLDDSEGHRRPVLEFLISTQGQCVWQDGGSERRFHTKLVEAASTELRGLLTAISMLETFARLLDDAFSDCLYVMTRKNGRVSPAELKEMPNVARACERVSDLFFELAEVLVPYGQAAHFQDTFARFAEKYGPEEWVALLLDHHRQIQRVKPPNGKVPWFERFDDGSYMIRPLYRRDKPGTGGEEYVYPYRTAPLWSFANDLGMID